MIVEVVVRILDPLDGHQVAGSLRQSSIVTTTDIERNTLRAQQRAHALAEEALDDFDMQCDETRGVVRDEPPEPSPRGHGRRR